MNFTSETFIAIVAAVTALVTSTIAIYNARQAARKDIVDLLQEELGRIGQKLQALELEKAARNTEYDKLLQRVFALETDNAALKRKIIGLEAENVRLVAENQKLQDKVRSMEESLLHKQDRKPKKAE